MKVEIVNVRSQGIVRGPKLEDVNRLSTRVLKFWRVKGKR